MSKLLKKEHEYFHLLMYNLICSIEPKFTKGAAEHRSKGDLWDMSDEELDQNIEDELKDLIVYWAEKERRKHNGTSNTT